MSVSNTSSAILQTTTEWWAMMSGVGAYKISSHFVAPVSSYIWLCTVSLCDLVHDMWNGAKKCNKILCSSSKIVCWNVFYDTASIQGGSCILYYNVHVVKTI